MVAPGWGVLLRVQGGKLPPEGVSEGLAGEVASGAAAQPHPVRTGQKVLDKCSGALVAVHASRAGFAASFASKHGVSRVRGVGGSDEAVGVSDNVTGCLSRGHTVVKHVAPALFNKVRVADAKIRKEQPVYCGEPFSKGHGILQGEGGGG